MTTGPCYLCAITGKDETCTTSVCDSCARRLQEENARLRRGILLHEDMHRALDKLLVCYRLRKRPSDALLSLIANGRVAIAAWAAEL